MTALKDYARLETSGLWRASPDAQLKEVWVSFGDATLVISDNTGKPLSHWSLAAVSRLNKSAPALFAPDQDAAETLEIEDEDMIRAIAKVQRAIQKARPKPGLVRWGVLGASTATIAWLAFFWLPGAMIDQAVAVVPDVKRQEIGAALLTRTARIAGQPCSDPFGTVALRRLENAVAPGETLHIMREGLSTTAALPGGHILIGRPVVEDHDDPSVAAGYVVAEMTRARIYDPLRRILEASGPFAAFRLLTTGDLPPDTLDAYAETVLIEDAAPVPTEALLFAFRDRKVPARPYAFAEDVTGEATFELIEADPYEGVAPVIHLTDGEWLSLQSICES
ncbi:MAG: hypothetical protein MK180_14940 [Rhodobacteraceae bacterium]|nr:hypothetical protein [Paracoccaceae bacterium]